MNCIWRRLPSKVGDALGFGQCFAQLVGQGQRAIRSCAEVSRSVAEFLQLGAFALELGAAGRVAALELALEFQVQLAAFGNEVAFDEIAFFEFACHMSQVS
jgi:hypothetical protein